MPRALVTPSIDVLWLGVAPLALALTAAVVPLGAPQVQLLTALASFPHFAGSYFVFYAMKGPWRRHLSVAFALPALLIAGTAAATGLPPLMAALAHGTLLLLYWHYAKQAFGVALWLGQAGPEPVPRAWRQALLATCLLLGLLGVLRVHGTSAAFAVFGVYLAPAALPPEALELGRLVAWAAVGALAVWSLRGGGSSRAASLMPLVALGSWSDPALGGPAVAALLPVFHGVQYLAFPMRVTWKSLSGASRSGTWTRFLALWVALIGLGYLLFRALPRVLTAWSPASPWAAAALITLNVHHYFVDAVLWRFREPEVQSRL